MAKSPEHRISIDPAVYKIIFEMSDELNTLKDNVVFVSPL